MIESMLEPHLREDASATQNQIGITFLILGGVYMVASPIMGFVSFMIHNSTIQYCKMRFENLLQFFPKLTY